MTFQKDKTPSENSLLWFLKGSVILAIFMKNKLVVYVGCFRVPYTILRLKTNVWYTMCILNFIAMFTSKQTLQKMKTDISIVNIFQEKIVLFIRAFSCFLFSHVLLQYCWSHSVSWLYKLANVIDTWNFLGLISWWWH